MDKMFIRFFVLVFVVAASVQGLNAQTGYMCDFESEAENSQWTMNQGLLGNNRWHIGAAVHNGGQKSMYVTADEGATAGYEAKSTLLVSYRTLTLPKDTFEIAFDWQAFGFDDNDALYVCWVDTTVITKSNTLSIVPNWVKENAIYFNDSIKLYSSTWQTAFDTIVSDGTARKLAFVWINGDRAAVSPAACIDNINIIPLSACQKPSNIEYTATDTSVMVTWDGLADSYDIRCTSTANPGEWVEQSGITENRFEIKGFGEGVFTVYIRSNCDNMHTVWASYKRFVFYPGSRCVDYLELTDKNCFYGVASVPRDKQGVIDYGYLARASRHTVHYDKEETDIRTNGNLPTVPDGEVASVRLGNWFWDFEGEAVEYPFRVDAATSGILLMKYAVVLQDPGHDPANQPRFQLKIRDKDGNIVGGGGCADIDFVSGSNTDGWIEASPLGDGEDPPLYKMWTTIGVNLQDYDGDTLRVCISSHDCSEGRHYGYAYFTLGCAGAFLEGLSCGEDNTNQFKAPDGFDYRWYWMENGVEKEKSTEQILTLPPTDTLTYYCDIMQKTDHDCYYTLSASAVPRFPDSRFLPLSAALLECRNVVQMNNMSTIIRVNPVTSDTTDVHDEVLDSVFWDFGDGTTSREWSPSHEYPLEGGTYTVTLRTYLSSCDDVESYTITLPHLGTVRDTMRVVCCEADAPYEFAGLYYSSSGSYSDTTFSRITGCDSITTLLLTIPPSEEILADTVCSDDLPYIFNGQECYKSDRYTFATNGVSGCDSTAVLDLVVNESLNIDFAAEVIVCADEQDVSIPYAITSGMVSDYSITFADERLAAMNVDKVVPSADSFYIELDSAILPGRYNMKLLLTNSVCGDVEREAVLRVDYPRSILAQRWDDVIGVRNERNNGGYRFSAVQWYKDGVAIDGKTSYNLYIPEGLDTAAQYSVLLTRADDGVAAYSCSLTPTLVSAPEEPVVVFTNSTVEVNSPAGGVAYVYNVAGQLVLEQQFAQGPAIVPVPTQPGIYIVEIAIPGFGCKQQKILQ